VVWLRAQLDADAARAEAAPRGPWSVDVSGSIVDADGGRVIPAVGGARDGHPVRWPEGPVVEHVVGHDPTRVLREIDAKRKLVALHDRPQHQCVAEDGPTQWHVKDPCATLRLLASVYSDRPGYLDSWRP
jgi:hypothetical protein